MEFFDYDPVTGITYSTDYDATTGDTILHKVQDVGPLIEHNQALANAGAKDIGIKKSWWHYCSIPPLVQVELMKKGIDITRVEHGKAMFREINTNYPKFKVTHKHHGG